MDFLLDFGFTIYIIQLLEVAWIAELIFKQVFVFFFMNLFMCTEADMISWLNCSAIYELGTLSQFRCINTFMLEHHRINSTFSYISSFMTRHHWVRSTLWYVYIVVLGHNWISSIMWYIYAVLFVNVSLCIYLLMSHCTIVCCVW